MARAAQASSGMGVNELPTRDGCWIAHIFNKADIQLHSYCDERTRFMLSAEPPKTKSRADLQFESPCGKSCEEEAPAHWRP